MILIDPEFIYNTGYLIITIWAFNFKFAYTILLFDVVKRSDDLKSVLMAIWLNVKNILKFAFLGFSLMYIYGIIGWTYFREFYGDNGWTFLVTVLTTIKEGLRSGGGISDAINPPTMKDSGIFWGRYAFDLTFFILINMLFI